ncbi:MAG: hypothetical protein IKN57_00880 [Parasporobacterium sp.]|nr:hypothetical protein [Parasporobacterium sp.]
MSKNKGIRGLLLLIAAAVLFAGCGTQEKKKEPGPETGKWHAEIKISDAAGSMSEEDRLLLSMLAGNIMFEAEAEFSEGGMFSYNMNTDKLKEAISESASTILGFFLSVDLSLFTDRLIESILQEELKSTQKNISGTYTKSENGMITANAGETLYFKINGNILSQLDANGREIMSFTKISSAGP